MEREAMYLIKRLNHKLPILIVHEDWDRRAAEFADTVVLRGGELLI